MADGISTHQPDISSQDNEDASIQSEAAATGEPTVATPEEDDREIAAAQAEVSVMNQAGRTNQRERTGDEALIGATGNADGVGAFEMVDESGELVKERFLSFLMEL